MKAIYVFSTKPSSGKGGIATAVESFCNCLSNYNSSLKVFITHDPARRRFGNFWLFLVVLMSLPPRFAVDLWNGKRPLIYVHLGPAGSLYRKFLIIGLARLFGFEVFAHHHSAVFFDYLKHDGINGKILRAVSRWARKNFVLSRWWYQEYTRFGIGNVVVVPNAVPDHFRLDEGNAGLILPDVCVNLLSLGRLVSGKNFELLIDVLAELDGRYRLVIGGDGPLIHELKRRANSLKVQERIEFLGWIGEVSKNNFFLNSHLFVLPSDHDSFGLVFVEALAMGCPVVASPNPAIVEALRGLKGVFIPRDFSILSIKEAVLRALSSSHDRKAIAADCRARYGLSNVGRILGKELGLIETRT